MVRVRIGLFREPKLKQVYCWLCGEPFIESEADFHEECHTYQCPNGHCFCSLTSGLKTQLIAMLSYDLWKPGNPCGRKGDKKKAKKKAKKR